METDENKAVCIAFLRKLKGKGKNLAGFEESVTILHNEAASRGLEDEDIALIVDLVKNVDLGAAKCVSLIKCMIPKHRIPNEILKDMISWCLTSFDSTPVTVSLIALQWIIGLWEYDLAERKTIDMFYEVFFFQLLRKEKLETHLARIIYELTKPEDVTRRQVNRLLVLQKNYKKPQKHLNALLSLFKSYKPELVPEKIPSVGISSTWKPIPDALRIGFEDAKTRASLHEIHLRAQENFKWTTTRTTNKGRFKEPVLPSVGYFHMGSSIFKEKDTKSIFDLSNMEDLGRYHKSVELPCNATSLLTNMAGYHLLTFADFEYQNRFSYNLYNTLRRAFIVEPGKYPEEELDKLLDMTNEFLRYMNHGIPIVTRFLDEYLTCGYGGHETKLLALFQWPLLSMSEMKEMVLKHMERIFLESSVEGKCEILRTLRLMLLNMYVNTDVGSRPKSAESPFLGQRTTVNLKEMVLAITNFAHHHIISGLNVHPNSSLFMAEALSFHEQMFLLENHYNMPLWTFAPSAVIHNGIVTKSCLILSRVCSLLIDYRETSKRLKKMNLHKEYSKEFEALNVYADELSTALWYGQSFSSRDKTKGDFLKTLSDRAIEKYSIRKLNMMLSLNHHYAVLPYKFVLNKTNLQIASKEDILNVACDFFPPVYDFLRIMMGVEAEAEREL